jgi:hypothetical protein
VEHVEPPSRIEADGLAATQPELDRGVAAQPGEQLLLIWLLEAVRRVPHVVLGQHRCIGLDPAAIALRAGEDRPRIQLAHPAVPAAVIDVGVGDQDQVWLGARGGDRRCERLSGRMGEASVDHHRALGLDQQYWAMNRGPKSESLQPRLR